MDITGVHLNVRVHHYIHASGNGQSHQIGHLVLKEHLRLSSTSREDLGHGSVPYILVL